MDWITVPFTKKLSADEIAYLNSLSEGFDRQLGAVSEYIGSEEFAELSRMNQQQINAFFQNSGVRQRLNEIIEYNAADSEQFIRNFYKTGAALGYSEIGALLAYTPADKEALYFLTQYNFELVRDLNMGLTESIREVIFNAVASGEGYQTTMRNLRELPLQPYSYSYTRDGRLIEVTVSARTRAEMIARTETARAKNTGTLQAYANYGVEMVEIITAGDSLVCDDCMDAEDQNPHTLQEAQSLLPMHPNCRCTYAPVVPDPEELTPVDNPPVMDLTEE